MQEDKLVFLKGKIEEAVKKIESDGRDPHSAYFNNFADGEFYAYKRILTMIEYLG